MTQTADDLNEKRTFKDVLLNQLNDPKQMRLGEKGMPEHINIGRIIEISQKVRGGDLKPLCQEVLRDGTTSEVVDLLVMLFVTRNTRGGKGEKLLAYQMFWLVWKAFPKIAAELLRLFPHYGYWKDLFLLMASDQDALTSDEKNQLMQTSIELIKKQLNDDLDAVAAYDENLKMTFDEDELNKLRRKGPSISLLAKWLPREGSALDKKLSFVSAFAQAMWPEMETLTDKTTKMEVDGEVDGETSRTVPWKSTTKARYRKTVAKLTSFLNLPEVLLACQREEEIRFEKLSSKATLRLRKTFLNENKNGDPRSENPKRIRLAENFAEFVLKKGLKGGQLMPHEIVSIIMKNSRMSKAEENVLDAQWKDLWRNVVVQVEENVKSGGLDLNPSRLVPMADVSGSMSGIPMEVSIALSIGLSEITHDAFKHMILTFSSTPKWHMLNPTDTIVQKVRSLQQADWGMSTNFEAAYDLILKVVEDGKLDRDDMPSLIVFSDMQFDQARSCSSTSQTMNEVIREKVSRVADRLGWIDRDPTPIVYWNLRDTGGHPVEKDTEGAVLLAGFSPSLLKLVMHGEALKEETIEVVQADGTVVTQKIKVTPEEIVRKMLNDPLYDPVREILGKSCEGKLLEYELLPSNVSMSDADKSEGA